MYIYCLICTEQCTKKPPLPAHKSVVFCVLTKEDTKRKMTQRTLVCNGTSSCFHPTDETNCALYVDTGEKGKLQEGKLQEGKLQEGKLQEGKLKLHK